MHHYTIGFVGGGNMARSLIGGLLADGIAPDRIWASDPDPERLDTLRSAFQVNATHDNADVVDAAEVVVLAVKPQIVRQVAQSLGPLIQAKRPLVISIAAGIREADLRRWLGEKVALVRSMPNTPALVQSGATALYANPYVSDGQRELAESILRAVGVTVWLDNEAHMDVVTALSGSGPAYFFLIMEALETAAVELGLAPDTARLLTLQTAFGAAKMALESEEQVDDLRQRVTSPGGTTEQAVRVLEQGGIRALFGQALKAAHQRSCELAGLLGES